MYGCKLDIPKSIDSMPALQAWLAEQYAAALQSRDAMERMADRLNRLSFQASRHAYESAAGAIKLSGAKRAIATIHEMHREGKLPTDRLAETTNMIHAQVAGMTLGEYLEAESATSWLERFGPQRHESEGDE